MRSFANRQAAVEFCQERVVRHCKAMDEVARKYDIIEDEVARVKYAVHAELSENYADLVELLSVESDGGNEKNNRIA